jgi:glyoxylase-like metal-dependent hydrolase (beta-lactamase superfamily II)
MILKTIVVGPNQTNCYILGSKASKEAVIIDPGADADLIKRTLSAAGLTEKYIINTHGHADHIASNKDFKVPILIHKADSAFLKSPYKNLSVFFGHFITSPAAEHFLVDGEKISVGGMILEIMYTPGHTPGGISIKTGKIVFTGDTLFAGGVGRTDLPGSSEKDLLDSIRNKLMVLDDSFVVYPGHGPASTIGEERRTNPYL